MKYLVSIVLICLATIGSHGQDSVRDSSYTGLLPKQCKESKKGLGDGVIYRAVCKGLDGYSIVALATEHSASIDLIGPDGKLIELDLRSAIPSAAPSSLGERAEWRGNRSGRSIKPDSLIVRVNIFPDPDNRSKTESYLAVVRLQSSTSCVVGVVPPSNGQNEAARKIADSIGSQNCL